MDLAIRLNPTLDMDGVSLQAARAEVLLALNKAEAALDSLNSLNSVPLLRLSEAKGLKGQTFFLRSKTLRELGRTDESLVDVKQAEDCLEADGALDLLVEALILHARILIFDVKSPKVAALLLERARTIAAADGMSGSLERIEFLFDRVNK